MARDEVRRSAVPGQLRRAAMRCSPAAGSGMRASSGTRTPTSRTSTSSSCPGGSRTATTCGRARSPGSRRRWRRWPVTPPPGGAVLGICNGFQVLCEAGLAARGAAAERLASLRLPAGGAGGRERRRRRSRASAEPGERLSIPVKHESGRYFAPADQLEALEARGGVVLRYAAGPQPQRLGAGHRRGRQRARERDGADAPSRARRGPAHRVRGRAARSSRSLAASAATAGRQPLSA